MPRWLSRPARVRPMALLLALTAATLGAPALTTAAGATASAPAPTSAATVPLPTGALVLRSAELAVAIDPAFPRVEQYAPAAGGTLFGNEDTLTDVAINGVAHRATVTAKHTATTATYHLTFADLPGIALDTRLSVDGHVLTFAVTRVTDPDKAVDTIDVPGMNLVSVRSNQTGATLAAAGFSVDPKVSSDAVTPITSLSPDAKAQGKSYAFVNTDTLAAGVETNTLTDPARLAVQTVARTGYQRTGVWSQPWVYREATTKQTTELPWAKVVVTGDTNSDSTVNWQDGANAFRSIMVNPYQADAVRNQVVPYISFNFASVAGQPFLKALDNVKRVDLATDGLGQNVLLKGYQSEGHDSAHPDYGNHINPRAGGVEDLRTLIAQGGDYNATFGVHVNSTESYPEAQNFTWKLGNPTANCWAWLDQSYCNDRHTDVTSGDLARRFAALKRQIPDPNLSYIYVDVSTGTGWDAWKLAQIIHANGWRSATEFPYDWERESTWSHWANDPSYGAGGSIRGVNSQIIRFLRNDQKDVFSPTPMLFNGQLADFAGWQGRVDINKAMQIVWTDDLPAKFQQHFRITRWDDTSIDFTDGLSAKKSGSNTTMTLDGRTIMSKGAYLLPWNDKNPDDLADADKLYHWNPKGGETTWPLPVQWATQRSLALYKLTTTGRVRMATLPVRDGAVTITAAKNTAYVLAPTGSIAPLTVANADFGAGSPVADPGFNAGSLRHWKQSGTASATVAEDSRGQSQLTVAGSGDAAISQRITGLQPGHTYSASVWVQVTKARRATLSVTGLGSGADKSVWTDSSPQPDVTGVDDKTGTNYQRMKVLVTVPANRTAATLSLQVAAGKGAVQFDDVRVTPNDGADTSTGGHYYTENFEHVDEGWGPFVYAVQGGSLRTHLSELHKNYTRDTIHGRFSLKTWNDGQGLVYRTVPQTLRFEPNHAYRVRFNYQSDTAGAYSAVIGRDGSADPILTQTFAQTTDRPLDSAPPVTDPKPQGWTDARPPQGSAPSLPFDTTFTTGAASCGNAYLGVTHAVDGGGLTMDDLIVDDLGPSTDTSCATAPSAQVSVSPLTVAAGKTGRGTVTVTNHAATPLTAGRVDLTTPSGWKATVSLPNTFTSLAPGASLRVPFTVRPPADTASSAYTVSAKVSFRLNGKATGAIDSAGVLIAYASLADAYNNVGTAVEGGPAGQFDSGGNAFSRSALASAGATPGGTVNWNGASFTWPSSAADTPDNVTAQGETIRVGATGFLAALVSASGTNAVGQAKITYTDGTTSQVQLGSPNWCCVDPHAYGATPVLDTDHNVDPSGAAVHQGTHYYVYGVMLPLAGGKTVSTVTLPNVPTLHVFALAPRPITPAPPTSDVAAGFLQWQSATNGWGPVERNTSNGENAAGDGKTITLSGTTYSTGLGTAPIDDDTPGVVTYDLAGKCTSFTATVGLDDEQPSRGSVTFTVEADGKVVYASPTLSATTRTAMVDVSIAGADTVRLLTGTGGDGPGNDHGDWADATFHCG